MKPIDQTKLTGWVDEQAKPARLDASHGFAGETEQVNDRAPTVTRWDVQKSQLGPLGWIPPGAFMQSTFWNSKAGASYRVNLLIQLPTGVISPFTFVVAPTSDRAVNTRQDPLPEGFILSMTVQPLTGGVKRGNCFATFNLSIGSGSDTINYRLLASGYVYNPHFVASPNMNENPLDGPGLLRSITGTDPAAGVEIVETVPTNARWRLLGLSANFVTSAAVANRVVGFIADDGTNGYFLGDANFLQVASLTGSYSLGYQGQRGVGQANRAQIQWPPALVLGAGHRIRSSTANMDGADNWGAPQYLIEEWIDI